VSIEHISPNQKNLTEAGAEVPAPAAASDSRSVAFEGSLVTGAGAVTGAGTLVEVTFEGASAFGVAFSFPVVIIGVPGSC
jgi:hypothetical protein